MRDQLGRLAVNRLTGTQPRTPVPPEASLGRAAGARRGKPRCFQGSLKLRGRPGSPWAWAQALLVPGTVTATV